MLSLVADYDTTSSSGTDDDSDKEDANEKELIKNSSTLAKPTTALVLPCANILLSKGSSKPTGDVFNNPFLEAEKLEIDKLQKHVKMVESENHLLQKNGRKICWNNRKGRCRFGNKCKYAHDSDLVEPKNDADVNKPILNNKLNTSTNTHNTTYVVAESVCNEKRKHPKRPGLGDSIVPGKRVMKTYLNLKKAT